MGRSKLSSHNAGVTAQRLLLCLTFGAGCHGLTGRDEDSPWRTGVCHNKDVMSRDQETQSWHFALGDCATLHLDGSNGPTGADAAAVRALAEALKTNGAKLSIDNEAVRALAEALKTNTVLTELRVYGTFGTEGAMYLAEALKVNVALKFLNLSHNSIGSEGVLQLAKSLKINKALTAMDLEGCKIGSEGAQELAEAL